MHLWWKAALAFLCGAFATLPGFIQTEVRIWAALLFADTLTGIWLAVARKELRSRSMREKLISKLLQYFTIGVMGRCAGLMAGTWVIDGLAVGICIGVEFTSNLENLTALAETGGVQLPGPAMRFLEAMGSIFAHASAEHGNAGHSAPAGDAPAAHT